MCYVVTDKDILSGRGGKVNQNRGNKVYRRFIAARKNVYKGLNAVDRPLLVRSIFETLESERYRFIRFNIETKQYETVDDDEIMIKITQSFRETDKKPVAKAKSQTGRVSERPFEGARQTEHREQSDASPSANGYLLRDVSPSQGSSFSDGSDLDDNETDSGLSDQTLEPLRFPSPTPWSVMVSQHPNYPSPRVFPAPLPRNAANDIRSWQDLLCSAHGVRCAPERPLEGAQQVEHRTSPFADGDPLNGVSPSQGNGFFEHCHQSDAGPSVDDYRLNDVSFSDVAFIGDVSSLQGSDPFEHRHQNNTSPFAADYLLGDVSSSQGSDPFEDRHQSDASPCVDDVDLLDFLKEAVPFEHHHHWN